MSQVTVTIGSSNSHDLFHDYTGSLSSQYMIRIFKQLDMISQVNIYVRDIVWILDMWCLCVDVKIQQTFIWFCKVSLRICYAILFERKGSRMLKTDNLILQGNIKYVTASISNFLVLYGENMVSKKSKIVCSVKVSRLKFVYLPIAEQLQPHFYKLQCVEQRTTKLDWKSTMYSVVKRP